MDISVLFFVLGMLLAAFVAAIRVAFATPLLQWGGMENAIWPTALALLILSCVAAILPFVPRFKRAIAASPYKRCYAVGYFLVVLYSMMGIGTIILLPFRAASGI
jgi:hypothetical protein